MTLYYELVQNLQEINRQCRVNFLMEWSLSHLPKIQLNLNTHCADIWKILTYRISVNGYRRTTITDLTQVQC